MLFPKFIFSGTLSVPDPDEMFSEVDLSEIAIRIRFIALTHASPFPNLYHHRNLKLYIEFQDYYSHEQK